MVTQKKSKAIWTSNPSRESRNKMFGMNEESSKILHPSLKNPRRFFTQAQNRELKRKRERERKKERERKRERERDRQTDRQTGRQTERQRDRETEDRGQKD